MEVRLEEGLPNCWKLASGEGIQNKGREELLKLGGQ
jgi:hypothetical protein